MSSYLPVLDVRTRRGRDDPSAPSPYDAAADADFLNRKGRPDRSHVVSISWAGGDTDADAERMKYNKASRGTPFKRIWVYLLALALATFSIWRFGVAPWRRGKLLMHLHDPTDVTSDKMAESVVAAFRHAWKGYEEHAWGFDELKPVSKDHSTWMNVGMTIIDALDTALVMGQTDIFDKALTWVTEELKFDYDTDSNVFELTIRVLGGLLSAHQMTDQKHPAVLARARELADILLVAFDTPSGLPLESVNFATRKPRAANHGAGPGSTAEITTLALEFKYLAHLTGDKKYWDAVQKVDEVIRKLKKTDGLVPVYMNTEKGDWQGIEIRLGSRGDSYYEYLGKQYLLTDEQKYLEDYRTAITGIRKRLLGLSTPNQFFFIGELQAGAHENAPVSTKMDHLVCFLPGTLALVATRGKMTATMEDRLQMTGIDLLDLELAEELAHSCWEMYAQTAAGLSPEIAFWKTATESEEENTIARAELERHKTGDVTRRTKVSRYYNGTLSKDIPLSKLRVHEATIRPYISGTGPVESDFDIHAMDGHNLLRPETIESFFVLWRVTGNPVWRERGRKMFEAFEKWCKVESGGYTSLSDVRVVPPDNRDKMETFFLGETLKYFYLLFAVRPTGESPSEDDVDGITTQDRRLINLEKFVLNTEAHAFPIFKPPSAFKQ
ncbi:mannosyl-oligosaccharide alpha-1,2-mannosidase [Thoreauomyces humboldtii]|nr:mannosyl-oligosaccharide alpha-1,2-mannosidase [Thoreauomyces humboldtii]